MMPGTNRRVPRRQRRRLVRARRGLSLVELVTAMTLMVIGLLAIVGVSSTVARSLGTSRQHTLAGMAAQSRFELIAGTECASVTLNQWTTVTTRGMTETFRVTDNGNNTLLVVDTVSWVTQRGTRKLGTQIILPCRPGA
jgi:Tfp pilus assembly protein PilV